MNQVKAGGVVAIQRRNILIKSTVIWIYLFEALSILEQEKSFGANSTLSDENYREKMGFLQALSIKKTAFLLENEDNASGLDFDLDCEVTGTDISRIV